jgi:hypothetical protein
LTQLDSWLRHSYVPGFEDWTQLDHGAVALTPAQEAHAFVEDSFFAPPAVQAAAPGRGGRAPVVVPGHSASGAGDADIDTSTNGMAALIALLRSEAKANAKVNKALVTSITTSATANATAMADCLTRVAQIGRKRSDDSNYGLNCAPQGTQLTVRGITVINVTRSPLNLASPTDVQLMKRWMTWVMDESLTPIEAAELRKVYRFVVWGRDYLLDTLALPFVAVRRFEHAVLRRIGALGRCVYQAIPEDQTWTTLLMQRIAGQTTAEQAKSSFPSVAKPFTTAAGPGYGAQANVPMGTCFIFARHGYCKHGDACKFKHVSATASAAAGVFTGKSGTAVASGRSNGAERLVQAQHYHDSGGGKLPPRLPALDAAAAAKGFKVHFCPAPTHGYGYHAPNNCGYINDQGETAASFMHLLEPEVRAYYMQFPFVRRPMGWVDDMAIAPYPGAGGK